MIGARVCRKNDDAAADSRPREYPRRVRETSFVDAPQWRTLYMTALTVGCAWRFNANIPQYFYAVIIIIGAYNKLLINTTSSRGAISPMRYRYCVVISKNGLPAPPLRDERAGSFGEDAWQLLEGHSRGVLRVAWVFWSHASSVHVCSRTSWLFQERANTSSNISFKSWNLGYSVRYEHFIRCKCNDPFHSRISTISFRHRRVVLSNFIWDTISRLSRLSLRFETRTARLFHSPRARDQLETHVDSFVECFFFLFFLFLSLCILLFYYCRAHPWVALYPLKAGLHLLAPAREFIVIMLK